MWRRPMVSLMAPERVVDQHRRSWLYAASVASHKVAYISRRQSNRRTATARRPVMMIRLAIVETLCAARSQHQIGAVSAHIGCASAVPSPGPGRH